MMEQESVPSIALLDSCQQELLAVMTDAFVRHAIDNRGLLTSPRRGTAVVTEIYDLAVAFLDQQASEVDVTAQASHLAEQGLAMVTAAAMLRALTIAAPAPIRQMPAFHEFQLLFLEKLASAREVFQQRGQERSQSALQRALHNQLEQQIISHEAQKQQNETLNQILQLTTQMNLAGDEQTLLLEAIQGFQKALNVSDISLYRFDGAEQKWLPIIGSGVLDDGDKPINETHRSYLSEAMQNGGETFHLSSTENQQNELSVTLILQFGSRILGGMIMNTNEIATPYENEATFIMMRTFAQNLAAQWGNRHLISETAKRTRELEILHGRYLDSIWASEQIALQARISGNQLDIKRANQPLPPAADSLPLSVGDHQVGSIHLPGNTKLTDEEQEFLNALIREMGSALNNAHFLQTARSYSNQLSLAADVSRAATTILDKDKLIQEVVNLIRDRFDFYYVGLFLLDEERKTAVLQAGTGEAGIKMVVEGFSLPVGGNSMTGTAVATGKAQVELDVAQARHFTFNANLPETKSELALPLRVRDRIIGSLSVQSKALHAFSQEGINVLQSLSDQLAIAIDNAGLFAQTQLNLEESTRLYETSRRINEATDAKSIYKALVDFAAESGLVDLVQIFVPDPASPEHFISPELWSRHEVAYDSEFRYRRQLMPFSDNLSKKEVVRIEDGQTDPNIDLNTRKLFTRNNIKAAALVPIFYEEEWLGSLALDRVTAVPLNDQELQPFITLVAQASTILYTQQLLRQTETLYRIGRLLNQSISRDDALDITVREVANYIGAVQCRIILFDHWLQIATLEAEHGIFEPVGSFQFPLTDDYIYQFLKQRRDPLILSIADEALDQAVRERHLTSFNTNTSLIIPASNQQELMGYLAIDTSQVLRPFTQAHIIFAQTVVDQLVTQIENIKLLDEALERAQELITLNQIQTNISHFMQLKQLAQSVYQQVGQLFDNTHFMLASYDPQTRDVYPILVVTDGTKIDQHVRRLQEGEPLHQFLQQNRHYLLDSDAPLMQAENKRLVKRPQKSLWIPMRREGKTTGFLCVQSYDPLAYDEHDVQMLRSIATHTNLAIDNAEFFTRIQNQNEELMEVDRLKTQFLANMSHELRTPLNSIIGFSRVILKGIDGPLTKEQVEDLTSIYSNGQHLLSLINEILDMAKIEAGKMALTFEEIDMVQTAVSVRDTIRGLIDQENVNLIWNVPEELPVIEADPIRIRQILINLLSNAAKYTSEGEIELRIEPEDDAYLHISVRDTGIGIEEEAFEKIFVAFEQADSSTTRAVGGTGLGLPITKWLVDMHQGHIFFESELNKGTTFHVIMPLQIPEKLIEPGETLPSL